MKNYYCQNSKYLTQYSDSTIYMAPKGSDLNCPDGLCGTGGSVANPLNTMEQVLTLASSSQFKEKVISVVAAHGNYEWGDVASKNIGQKRIDVPKNISNIICNEGIAQFGSRNDRRTIGLFNHPSLTFSGLRLYADIEATSDEGKSVFSKKNGELWGKYILKAEKKGTLSVNLDKITQIIDRPQLRDDKWDNESHVKDTAKLIMKITNTNKTSLFGKALVKAEGDGELDATTKDGTNEDCGCSSVSDGRSKVHQSTKGMKFSMRGRDSVVVAGAKTDTELRPFFDFQFNGAAKLEHNEQDNRFSSSEDSLVSPSAVYSQTEETSSINVKAQESTKRITFNRSGNNYELRPETKLEDFLVQNGHVEITDKNHTVVAKGKGPLSSFQFGGNVEVLTDDNKSKYDAPQRHFFQRGSGNARWEDYADGVKYMIAGSDEKYDGNSKFRENHKSVTTRCEHTFGYHVVQDVKDSAQVSSSNIEPDEVVSRQPDKSEIYNSIQDGSNTFVEKIENGGTRTFDLRADIPVTNREEQKDVVGIRNTKKGGQSSERGNQKNHTFFSGRESKNSNPKGPVIGELVNLSGSVNYERSSTGNTSTAYGFGDGDILNNLIAKDQSRYTGRTNGKIYGFQSSTGNPSAYRLQANDNAKVNRDGTTNAYGGGVVADIQSRVPSELTENGSRGTRIDLKGSGEIFATIASSIFETFLGAGGLRTQLDNVKAEIADFQGGTHNIANSIINKVNTVKSDLTTSFSKLNQLITNEGTSSTRYSSVTGPTFHRSGDHEHLFSQFENKVELNHPDITKIMNFKSSQSSYKGDSSNTEEAAIIATGAQEASISANIGVVESVKDILLSDAGAKDVTVSVTAGQLAKPATDTNKPVKFSVSGDFITQPNVPINM